MTLKCNIDPSTGNGPAEYAAPAHGVRRPIQPTCWLASPTTALRVSDTRKKSPIYVNWKTGQLIGRSGPVVAGPLLALRMAGLLVCLSVYWGCRSSEAPPAAGTGSTPARGGELLATIRSEPATYNRYVPAGAVGGHRRRDLPHPGPAGSRQSRDRRARAVAGRGLDRVGRQPWPTRSRSGRT